MLGRHIEQVGAYGLVPKNQDTFESLVQAIVYQQLNGKAAATIHGRVVKALGGRVTPRAAARTSDASLRGAGLSANKLLALRDLTEKSLSGIVPPREKLESLPDADIIARLTEVRGVGEWTAQMFLMFKLGRPDVLPTGDYGVRKAFGLLYRKNGRLPPPSALEKHGKKWAPYRTVASWYLWRRLDIALLLAALLIAAPARAQDGEEPFARLSSSSEPAVRIQACEELSRPPHRGTRAYQSLGVAMFHDLSDRVRLAAAVGAITYPGGRTLDDVDAFLKAESGAEVRRDLIVALSTEPAHFENPDATRIIASALSEDSSVEVRLAAAEALGARGDALALGAVGRASEKDKDKGVRDAARRSMLILSKPPKPKPKPQLPDPPKPGAVFGKDPCPPPWGWCVCVGAVALKPKCLTHDECRTLASEMRRRDLACKWDGRNDD